MKLNFKVGRPMGHPLVWQLGGVGPNALIDVSGPKEETFTFDSLLIGEESSKFHLFKAFIYLLINLSIPLMPLSLPVNHICCQINHLNDELVLCYKLILKKKKAYIEHIYSSNKS